MGSLFHLRRVERRPAFAAFGFLTLLVASHAVLETARDALFLARLPASHLPVVYIAIALVSLTVARLETRFSRVLAQRTALVCWTAVAALGTLLLWWILPTRAPRTPEMSAAVGLYVLYVWSGMIAGLVLVHFWLLLGGALSVTQAKRLYPMIGAGSVIGALFGSALASFLGQLIVAERLLLVAAGGFGLSTLAAAWLGRFAASVPRADGGVGLAGPAPQADPTLDLQAVPSAWSGAEETRMMEDAKLAARQPYVRRIALLVLVSAASLTLVDYMFKSTVARSIPAEELGTFFGGVALGLNVLSLICQLTLSAWLLKRVDLGLALAILPSVLAAGGIALLLGLGLGAALFTKSADGALRYSLHRTASELLYVPLPDRARPRIKAVLDLVGQRAGQAFASLAILVFIALELPATVLPASLLVLTSLWAIFALGLRRDYVELLRGNLRGEGSLRTLTFPEFDVASLETLVSALDSHNDTEVLAALAVLERERKAHLVPALILHHPSDAVVEAALALFARARRDNVIHVIDRLFEHPSSRVRSAAIAARSLLLADPRLLYLRLSLEDSPEVRATIIVHLIASGEIVGSEADERLREILQRGRTPTKIALAEAIAWRQDADFDQVLIELTAAPEVEVRLASIRAMTEHTSTAFLTPLLHALGDEQTRSAARHALVGYGTSGFEAVLAALRDVSQPQTLRWELPRALSLFEPEPAVQALLMLLTSEPEGMVRYRIIRALETLVARHPTVNLDRAALERVMSDTIGRAYRHINERVTLEAGARNRPERQTPGHELLVFVLRDKQENARDRLFRLLGLAYPTADFARIRRGLRSASADTRESSVELVGTLLEQPMRGAVLGLIEDMTDAERLAWSGPYYTPVRRSYEDMLEHMLTRESQGVQDFTAYHVAELGLWQLRPLIAAIAEADPARADVARTLAALEHTAAGNGA